MQQPNQMKVIKRDGSREAIVFDKIVSRITHLCSGTDINGVRYGPELKTIDIIRLSMSVIAQIKDGITTRELDEYTAEHANTLIFDNPEYGLLASRILISNHHKNTTDSFSITMKRLYEYKDIRGVPNPLISRDLYKLIERFGKRIDAEIDYLRDYLYSVEGFKTLERAYLIKHQSGTYMVQERPQHMIMRKALGIFGPCSTAMMDIPYKPDIEEMLQNAFREYYYASLGYETNATPTLFAAGTPKPQLSSCFLGGTKDSLRDIYKTASNCAMISKHAGGIGLFITDVRPAGSYIRGTNGHSNGIIPMLKVFNDTAKYVDQCFTPDTLLFTPKGSVPIGELAVGDSLFTHTGGIRNIERVLRHKVKTDIYRISTKSSLNPVVVTPEHQVLAIKGNASYDIDLLKTRLNNGYAELEWSDVRDLNVGDYVCYPEMCKSVEKDIPELTVEDLHFYGVLVSRGVVSPDMKTISLCLSDKIYDYCRNFLRDLVQDCSDLMLKGEKENTWVELAIERLPFTLDSFYDVTTRTKKMDNRFYLLPKDKCLAICQGMGLGCVNVNGPNAFRNADEKLSEAIQFLMWRTDLLSNDFKWDNCYITRITQIEVDKYDGYLYDLEITEDHTYITANLGIVHNGGGKRMGSFAVYLEPWHPEIVEFLEAKLPSGHEERRARDLFYGFWTPDLFMEKVELAIQEEAKAKAENRKKKTILWSTFCPDECPGLSDCWGAEFNELYLKYEGEGRARSQIDVMIIWEKLLVAQKEHGGCFLLFKDSANKKSNQQNLGTTKCSNLCTEIIEYSSSEEYATCNLASLSLPKFVLEKGPKDTEFKKPTINPMYDYSTEEKEYEFDHKLLYEITYFLTINLNKVIDINYYPIPETLVSNQRHRPIGIGVQGLADLFHILHYPFDSPEAFALNRDIFETIYYAALKSSNDLAKRDGAYSTFRGSPASKGILQFDMWNYKPVSGRYDWDALKKEIVTHGLRNSLVLAPMPTASTAAILGNNECFEPYSYNIFVKRVLSGEFFIANKHLQRDLIKLGLWSDNMKKRLIETKGSVQDEKIYSDIPAKLRNQYKTAFELKQKVLIDMAAARGVFIDQSQSLNLFVQNPTDSILTSMHLYSWKQGLKTGLYYLRRGTVATAQAFTTDARNFSEHKTGKLNDATKPNPAATVSGSSSGVSASGVSSSGVSSSGVSVSGVSVSGLANENGGDKKDAPLVLTSANNEKEIQPSSLAEIPMCRRDNPSCESCSG